MKATVSKVAVLLLLILSAATYTYAAHSLTVTKTADTADGVCDSDCSLREAVAAAAPGDTIVFSPLFLIPQTITLTNGQIAITKDLTITGTGRGLLSLSGNNAGRIFRISGGAVVMISRMKLRDGHVGTEMPADPNGGAIFVTGGRVTLVDMEFTNNRAFMPTFPAGSGGAIFGTDNCVITLDRVLVHNNTARFSAIWVEPGIVTAIDSIINNNSGGIAGETVNLQTSLVLNNTGLGVGAHILTMVHSKSIGNGRGVGGGDASSSKVIDHCVISGNGTDGGLTNSGLAFIRNSEIVSNRKVGWGGGISNTGTMYVVNSYVVNNIATESGGGIFNAVGHLFLTNTTVSGNVAGSAGAPGMRGGGIHNLVNSAAPGGRITLTNATVVNNRTTGGGGDVSNDPMGVANLRNTLIAGNLSSATSEVDTTGVFTSAGFNLIGSSVGGTGWLASDLLNQDPLLAPLGNNGGNTYTHALQLGSPAIDAGNNSMAVDPQTMLALTIDQRGFERFLGKPARVDIGAYEAFYSSSPVSVSGKLTSFKGRGVHGALIKLTDLTSETVSYTISNPFGYYRFLNLVPGRTYSISIIHKSYSFDSNQYFTADQNREDLNFAAGL